jgi:hypothetical protein
LDKALKFTTLENGCFIECIPITSNQSPFLSSDNARNLTHFRDMTNKLDPDNNFSIPPLTLKVGQMATIFGL